MCRLIDIYNICVSVVDLVCHSRQYLCALQDHLVEASVVQGHGAEGWVFVGDEDVHESRTLFHGANSVERQLGQCHHTPSSDGIKFSGSSLYSLPQEQVLGFTRASGII